MIDLGSTKTCNKVTLTAPSPHWDSTGKLGYWNGSSWIDITANIILASTLAGADKEVSFTSVTARYFAIYNLGLHTVSAGFRLTCN